MQITSNTTATFGPIDDNNGTLVVEPGNTLIGSAVQLAEPSAALTIAATATLALSGHASPIFAPISGVWGSQTGNPFALTFSSGTAEIDGSVLAGPAVGGGGGGSSSIGYDSNTLSSVTVNAGATVTDTHLTMGSHPSSSGTLTLNGPGATWTDVIDSTDTARETGDILLGYDDLSANTPAPPQAVAAQLTIENGATMTEQRGGFVGNTLDSSGTATVSGGGVWNITSNSSFISSGVTTVTNVNAGFLNVGFNGDGLLSVLNGGTVAMGATGTYYNNGTTFTGSGIGIGISAAASTGTVIVSGANSLLSTLGGINVAKFGQGLLSVLNGGVVQVNGGSVSIGTVSTVGPSGTVSVGGSGAASAMNFAAAAGGLTVGNASKGMLNLLDNGTIDLNGTGFLTVGSAAGSVGSVVVGGTGASAVINIGTKGLTVGFMGTGVATVTSLGTIALTGTNAIIVGQSVGSSGMLIVNGGLVSESSTTGGITAGLSGGAAGTISVSGAGAEILNASAVTGFSVGQAGTGEMTVDNVGFVQTTNNFNLWGTGHVAITNGAKLEANNFVFVRAGSSLSVDASSAIDVGVSNTYTTGAIVVEPTHGLWGAGLVNGTIVNNGPIRATSINNGTPSTTTSGTLDITGPVGGSGALQVAPGATSSSHYCQNSGEGWG